jgi:hypothetical protein
VERTCDRPFNRPISDGYSLLIGHAWETPFVHQPKAVWTGKIGCKRIVEQVIGPLTFASTSDGGELRGHGHSR